MGAQAAVLVACSRTESQTLAHLRRRPVAPDIKPENILYFEGNGGSAPEFVIADLGLATSADRGGGSASGEQVGQWHVPADSPPPSASYALPAGTRGFMAPELVQGGGVYGRAVDSWALAVTVRGGEMGEGDGVGGSRSDRERREMGQRVGPFLK